MSLLARNEFETLAEPRLGPCVSIFLPTHRAAPERQQNPVDLKNLLRQAEEKLIAKGLRALQIEPLLAPARLLVENPRAWEHPGEGLALFLAPGFFREYHLPLRMEQLAAVADRFHLKPLLPAFADTALFYVLALSQEQVRLFACTALTVAEVELGDTPRSLAEALHFDDPQNQIQFHSTRTRNTGGRGAAMFHGHGAVAVDVKRNVLVYFQQVNEGVRRVLKEPRAPLVLAGVEYLLGLYRRANTYPNLVAGGVAGNPELLSGHELQRRAWELAKTVYETKQEAAVARYYHLISTSRQASDELETVVRAAHQGRVDTLWVVRGAHRWGRYDPETEAVEVHEDPGPEDGDLLDLAAVQSLLKDGTVHVVEPEQAPDEATAAAIFRY